MKVENTTKRQRCIEQRCEPAIRPAWTGSLARNRPTEAQEEARRTVAILCGCSPAETVLLQSPGICLSDASAEFCACDWHRNPIRCGRRRPSTYQDRARSQRAARWVFPHLHDAFGPRQSKGSPIIAPRCVLCLVFCLLALWARRFAMLRDNAGGVATHRPPRPVSNVPGPAFSEPAELSSKRPTV